MTDLMGVGQLQKPCGLSVLFYNPRVGRLIRHIEGHLPSSVHPATSRFNGRNGRH